MRHKAKHEDTMRLSHDETIIWAGERLEVEDRRVQYQGLLSAPERGDPGRWPPDLSLQAPVCDLG
jgi:hypothetical protein